MIEKPLDISASISIDRLVNSPYSFAAYRLPEGDVQTVISLKEVVQVDDSLDVLSAGFLFNRFQDNHPAKPYFIPADILVNKEVNVDPRISAQDLEEFIASAPTERFSKTTLSSNPVANTDFEKLVEKAISEIKSGKLEKVVLARSSDVDIPVDFSLEAYFKKICQEYPHSFCSIVSIPGQGVWMGASPEILISSSLEEFKTVSLAGTKKMEKDQSLAEIAWTQKEIEEQAFVSRYVINCFKKIRLREFTEHGPKTIKAGNLAHLKTEYSVNQAQLKFDQLEDQMLELLHPTSAVCGMPLESAKSFIHENESLDREFYAGFLGPHNIDGSTYLFVNLRCMKVEKNKARLYAGAGITEDSNPQAELKETELKMSVLKNLI